MLESLKDLLSGVNKVMTTIGNTSHSTMSDAIDESISAVERELEQGWIEFPKDANGAPIHIGDKLDYTSTDGTTYHLTVSYMLLQKANDETFWKCIANVKEHNICIDLFGKLFKQCVHYEPPTVKNTLDELIDRVIQTVANQNSMTDGEYERKLNEIRDACAVKFRLVDER